ncbi:MAG TPA: hypothetical protein VFC51_15705 [Chloroflexota bacterium]|nr:hypothetical protein [Chloroflexota bacterium]
MKLDGNGEVPESDTLDDSELAQDIEEAVEPEAIAPAAVPSLTLQDALADFVGRKAQASNRMLAIQQLVAKTLFERGLHIGDFVLEQSVPGKHRTKKWDVVYSYRGRIHLAVSCKSIMANVAGTVPNRIDDAIGECANIHAYDPGIVLGYFFVMDKAGGMRINRDLNLPWYESFGRSLASLSGRRSQHNSHDLFEAATLLLADFSVRPFGVEFYPRTLSWDDFFDTLIDHVRDRNPTLRNRLDAPA